MMTDELWMRAITSLEIAVQAPEREAIADLGTGGRILLVDDRRSSYERLAPLLSAEHTIDVEPNPAEALLQCRHQRLRPSDRIVFSLRNFDGPRLGSQVRLLERTWAGSDPGDRRTPTTIPGRCAASEIGVNDYLLRPADGNDQVDGAGAHPDPQARAGTDRLRDNVQNSIEMAITDALTGLHNRRYMESHLEPWPNRPRSGASRWR